MGDVLVAGIHSDAEITKNKGSPPVIPEEERITALRACKFVDEVIWYDCCALLPLSLQTGDKDVDSFVL